MLSQLDGKLEKLERRVGHMESRMATVVPDAAPTHVDDDGGDEEDMQDEDGDQDQQQQQQQ